MIFLQILIQTVIDWARDILVEILGRHAEDFLGERIARRWRTRSRKRDARRKGVKRKGKQPDSGPHGAG